MSNQYQSKRRVLTRRNFLRAGIVGGSTLTYLAIGLPASRGLTDFFETIGDITEPARDVMKVVRPETAEEKNLFDYLENKLSAGLETEKKQDYKPLLKDFKEVRGHYRDSLQNLDSAKTGLEVLLTIGDAAVKRAREKEDGPINTIGNWRKKLWEKIGAYDEKENKALEEYFTTAKTIIDEGKRTWKTTKNTIEKLAKLEGKSYTKEIEAVEEILKDYVAAEKGLIKLRKGLSEENIEEMREKYKKLEREIKVTDKKAEERGIEVASDTSSGAKFFAYGLVGFAWAIPTALALLWTRRTKK